MTPQERINAAASYLLAHTAQRPTIGLVLGSGMDVIGVSCITNMAAGILPVKLSHAEVMETAAMVHDLFHKLEDTILNVV